MTAESVRRTLSELKPYLRRRYKVKELALFGSLVRGEQSANSDVDLLADFDESADLFDLIGLALYLEGVLQRRVDVVPKRALRAELKETVLRDAVAV